MTSYKMYIYFYIIIITSRNVLSDCDQTVNVPQCAYDIFCQEEYFNFYNYVLENYRSDYNQDFEGCKHYKVDLEYYNQWDFYPIHLTYKNTFSSYTTRRVHNTYIPETESVECREILHLVTYLDVSQNNYYFYPNFTQLENLAVINLSRNNLSIAKLSNEFNLPSLSEIDLSHNYISDIQYKSENVYRALKKIDMSYNNLIEISNEVFRPFNKLEILNITHNYIEILRPNTFEGLEKLINFNISYNRLFGINSSLVGLHNLKQLDLSNNRIQAVKAIDFRDLTSLQMLNLNNNFLGTIAKDVFQSTTLLNRLYLNNNKLESIDIETFQHLSHLAVVDLSENKLKVLPKDLLKGNYIQHFFIKDNELEGSLQKGSFEGLTLVTILDLSGQNLQSVEDYAFIGLHNLFSLLLNNNKIMGLSAKCFRSMRSLKQLNLSSNAIENIEFENDDLLNLTTLALRNNHLTVIKQQHFRGLYSLQFLDLSNNRIAQIEMNSFTNLKELIKFEISNNTLSGSLEENTFNGMSSLPILDISCTFLSKVCNGSLTSMVHLINLNVSHSNINKLEYNTFQRTDEIEILDLSHNELIEFKINSSQLSRLSVLYLNNNMIEYISVSSFQDILLLRMLVLAFNSIQIIESYTFQNQKKLVTLDISNNNMSIIETDGFIYLRSLRDLDISNNKIANIQPGSFKDNSKLETLNMSHNILTAVPYGLLSGLTQLQTLNISYNNIGDLNDERFHEINSLRIIIADHNEIKSIKSDEFLGTSLTLLSLGENPIPCEVLVNFIQLIKLSDHPFYITAINLDVNNDENVGGIICNKKLETLDKITNGKQTGIADESNILFKKILDVLTINLEKKSFPVDVTYYSAYDNLYLYISKVKHDLDETKRDIETRISSVNSHIDALLLPKEITEQDPKQKRTTSEDSKSAFTEACVALILVILVIFFLLKAYKIYKKSGMCNRGRLSLSNRELPGAMDSTL